MADAGSVSVEVRARLDTLERDLAMANRQLQQFHNDANKGFDTISSSTQKTDKTLQDLNKTLDTVQKSFDRLTESQKKTENAIDSISYKYGLLGVAASGAMKSSFSSPALEGEIAANAARVATITRAVTLYGAAVVAATTIAIGAWALARKAVEDASAAIQKASDQRVSVSFFVGMEKGAKDLKVSLDQVFAAFQRLDQISQKEVGGNALQHRIAQFQESGTLIGNTGVAELQAATTSEQKWNAVVNLIDQAMQKGERLAALDIAKRFLPPELFARLEAFGDTLTRLQQKAEQNRPTPQAEAIMNYAKTIQLAFSDSDKRIAESTAYWEKELAKPWLESQSFVGMKSFFGQLFTYLKETVKQADTAASALRFGLFGKPETQTQRLYNINPMGGPQPEQFGPLSKDQYEGELRDVVDAAEAAANRLRRGALSATRRFGVTTLTQTIPAATGVGPPQQIETNVPPEQSSAAVHSTNEFADAVNKLNVQLRDENNILRATKEALDTTDAVYGDISGVINTLVHSYQQATEAAKMERSVIGQSAEAAMSAKVAFDLLRAAQNQNPELSGKQLENLKAQYKPIADALAAEKQRLAVDQEINKLKERKFVADMGPIGTNEVEVIRELQHLFGGDWINQLNSVPANLMRVAQQAEADKEAMLKLREATQNFKMQMDQIRAVTIIDKANVAAANEMVKALQEVQRQRGANAQLSDQELATAKAIAEQQKQLVLESARVQTREQLKDMERQLNLARAVTGEEKMQVQQENTYQQQLKVTASSADAMAVALKERQIAQAQIDADGDRQLDNLQEQFRVAGAVTGVEKARASAIATTNTLIKQGMNAQTASAIGAQQFANAMAQADANARNTVLALQDQEAVAGAVTGAAKAEAEAQATYNKLIREGASEATAQAAANQVLANAQAAANANVERQIISLNEQTELMRARQNGSEAATKAEQAFNQALREGADLLHAQALEAATLDNEMEKANQQRAQGSQLGQPGVVLSPGADFAMAEKARVEALGAQTEWVNAATTSGKIIAGMVNGVGLKVIETVDSLFYKLKGFTTVEQIDAYKQQQVEQQARQRLESEQRDQLMSQLEPYEITRARGELTGDTQAQIKAIQSELAIYKTAPETLENLHAMKSLQDALKQLTDATNNNSQILSGIYSRQFGQGFYDGGAGPDEKIYGLDNGTQIQTANNVATLTSVTTTIADKQTERDNTLRGTIVNVVTNGTLTTNTNLINLLQTTANGFSNLDNTFIEVMKGNTNVAANSNLQGFASGGKFKVPGSGSSDSVIPLIRVRPQEVISIGDDKNDSQNITNNNVTLGDIVIQVPPGADPNSFRTAAHQAATDIADTVAYALRRR